MVNSFVKMKAVNMADILVNTDAETEREAAPPANAAIVNVQNVKGSVDVAPGQHHSRLEMNIKINLAAKMVKRPRSSR